MFAFFYLALGPRSTLEVHTYRLKVEARSAKLNLQTGCRGASILARPNYRIQSPKIPHPRASPLLENSPGEEDALVYHGAGDRIAANERIKSARQVELWA